MIKFLDIQKINRSFQPRLSTTLQSVVDSGWYVKGPRVQEFEERYASFIGTRFCVGVGNGFDALRLIFRAWMEMGELHHGDEVIVPANTYIASILAVSDNGLTPVFVEPDPVTFNLDAQEVGKKISPRTKAILLVHLYGRNGMTSELKVLAQKHNMKVVEDNAQAAGCLWHNKRTGSLGDAGAHSFFPSKNLGALGDGGAITTDDRSLSEMVRTLGHYGSHQKSINDVKGVNSRLDEIQAAVLDLKLPRLDEDNAARRKIADFYREGIRHPAITLPQNPEAAHEHVWHLFVVRCSARDALQAHLRDRGIETMIHYPVPPHQQKAYRDMNGLSFPVTEHIHREVLSLPLSPVMEWSAAERIVEAANGFER
jgi:dTDP-4-amino-4,6-dideoxygalactose transaminase